MGGNKHSRRLGSIFVRSQGVGAVGVDTGMSINIIQVKWNSRHDHAGFAVADLLAEDPQWIGVVDGQTERGARVDCGTFHQATSTSAVRVATAAAALAGGRRCSGAGEEARVDVAIKGARAGEAGSRDRVRAVLRAKVEPEKRSVRAGLDGVHQDVAGVCCDVVGLEHLELGQQTKGERNSSYELSAWSHIDCNVCGEGRRGGCQSKKVFEQHRGRRLRV